jgi:hypothetical protein
LDAARSVADFIGDHVKQGGLAFDFPQLGEVDTTRFIKEYYRGMEFFNNILERKFQYGDKQISAFLTTNKTPERTRTALLEFLETDGIAVEIHQVEGVKFYQVDDPYEGQWFFVPLAEQLLGVYAPLDDTLQQHILTFAQQNTS